MNLASHSWHTAEVATICQQRPAECVFKTTVHRYVGEAWWTKNHWHGDLPFKQRWMQIGTLGLEMAIYSLEHIQPRFCTARMQMARFFLQPWSVSTQQQFQKRLCKYAQLLPSRNHKGFLVWCKALFSIPKTYLIVRCWHRLLCLLAISVPTPGNGGLCGGRSLSARSWEVEERERTAQHKENQTQKSVLYFQNKKNYAGKLWRKLYED